MNAVIDIIPKGHSNAITIDEIERRTGFSNREIRRAIAASEELVINIQDGKGYFKPKKTESRLVEQWKKQTLSRVKELNYRASLAMQWQIENR